MFLRRLFFETWNQNVFDCHKYIGRNYSDNFALFIENHTVFFLATI